MNKKSKKRYCQAWIEKIEKIDFLSFYHYHLQYYDSKWEILAIENSPIAMELISAFTKRILKTQVFNLRSDHDVFFFNRFLEDMTEYYMDLENTLEKLENNEITITTTNRDMDIKKIRSYLMKKRLEDDLDEKPITTKGRVKI
ncbi:hypothetical protein QZN08_27140 [Burkholderia multivorans]|nr:hypothetical protein [Burkholderia multivorans]